MNTVLPILDKIMLLHSDPLTSPISKQFIYNLKSEFYKKNTKRTLFVLYFRTKVSKVLVK